MVVADLVVGHVVHGGGVLEAVDGEGCPVPVGGAAVFRVGQEREPAEADQFATDRIVDHRHADWIRNNHRASNARHVAAEDDADAATGRHRQPQWAQVGDVPAAGKSRLGTSGVSRK